MPFPDKDPLADVLRSARSELKNLKQYLNSVRTQLASADTSANVLIELYLKCLSASTMLTGYQTYPGLIAYAQEQFEDQNLDVDAIFTSIKDGVAAIVAAISGGFPTGTGGYILKDKLVSTGIQVRTFTPAQSAPIIAEIDTTLGSFA